MVFPENQDYTWKTPPLLVLLAIRHKLSNKLWQLVNVWPEWTNICVVCANSGDNNEANMCTSKLWSYVLNSSFTFKRLKNSSGFGEWNWIVILFLQFIEGTFDLGWSKVSVLLLHEQNFGGFITRWSQARSQLSVSQVIEAYFQMGHRTDSVSIHQTILQRSDSKLLRLYRQVVRSARELFHIGVFYMQPSQTSNRFVHSENVDVEKFSTTGKRDLNRIGVDRHTESLDREFLVGSQIDQDVSDFCWSLTMHKMLCLTLLISSFMAILPSSLESLGLEWITVQTRNKKINLLQCGHKYS